MKETKALWRSLGVVAYYCTWPALWLYLRGTTRTRVILRHDGKILVVKNWLGNGDWRLPGGGMKAGEPAEIGARRELNEELHFQNTKLTLKPLAIEPYTGRGFSYISHFFVADLASLPELKKHGIEILDFAWVDPKTLNSSNSNPDTIRALSLLEQR
jgi:8-oxo-dGTP pyrophosphatase MutT (NUDIX family)